MFQLGAGGGADGRAHHRQGKQGQQDQGGEGHEHGLPRHDAEQVFGQRRAKDLTSRASGGGDAKGERAVFIRGSTAHHGEDHAKSGASDAKANEDFQPLMLGRGDGVGRQHEAQRVDQRARDDGLAVADLFGNRAKDRLANAPREVLDRDGEGEF